MDIQSCTVGEIVSKDSRAAAVFEKYHIDFCCNGHKTLKDASPDEETLAVVEGALRRLPHPSATTGLTGGASDYEHWPIDLLADLIEKKYHRETAALIGKIQPHLEKLCRVHGEAHPELFDVRDLFDQSAGELTVHMRREELVLFPFIRKMVQTGQRPAAPFGNVDNPIGVLTHEHAEEGERFRRIAQLTGHYTVPPDGCNTYRLTLQLLQEFESMLHFHIHLENNLLFPKALVMAENCTS